jgi:o-succinylbenzoate---CoA ligase
MRSDGRELVALQVAQGPSFRRRLEELWAGGAAVLPLDPDLPAREVRTALARMRPAALVTDRSTEPLDGAAAVDPDTDLVVLTSGSSGQPKGVELARSALRAGARMTIERLGCRPGERWLCCVPVTRIAGLALLERAELLDSDPLVLERFDVETIDRDDSCRYISLVPTMLHRLVEARVDLSRFDAILLGGAASSPPLLDRAQRAGARVIRTYGMTETCGGVVYDGRPLEGVRVEVGDDDVVSLATPSVMNGYRMDPSLTEAVLQDGWYRTGDVGEWDGNALRVWGREDDAIVTGGEKVFPFEVERALLAHPQVRTARVFGEPDEEWGQRVMAHVTADIDEQALRSFLKERLARYKVPASIDVRDAP